MKKWMGGVLLAFIVAAAVFAGTFWYKGIQKKREQERQTRQMIRQDIEEKARLASLGDVSIDPSGLTLGKLNDILRQPAHKLAGAANSSTLGWACGVDCAVEAAFLLPPGSDVPVSTAPMVLIVSGVGFGKPFQGSIGGIHLGDPVDVVLKVCRQRGYEVRKEAHRVSWDKDWEVAWTESDRHTVSSLFFLNRTVLNVIRADLRGHNIEN